MCAPHGLSHNPHRYSYGYPYSYSYGGYPYGYGGYGPDYSYYYNSYAAAQNAYEADAQQAAEGEQSRADWEAYRNSLPVYSAPEYYGRPVTIEENYNYGAPSYPAYAAPFYPAFNGPLGATPEAFAEDAPEEAPEDTPEETPEGSPEEVEAAAQAGAQQLRRMDARASAPRNAALAADAFLSASRALDAQQARLDKDRAAVLQRVLPAPAFPTDSKAALAAESSVAVTGFVPAWRPDAACTAAASAQKKKGAAEADPLCAVLAAVAPRRAGYAFEPQGNKAATSKMSAGAGAGAREVAVDGAVAEELAPLNVWQLKINKERRALIERSFGSKGVARVTELGWEPSFDPQGSSGHLHWDTLPTDAWHAGDYQGPDPAPRWGARAAAAPRAQQLGWAPTWDAQGPGKHLHWDTMPQDAWVGGSGDNMGPSPPMRWARAQHVARRAAALRQRFPVQSARPRGRRVAAATAGRAQALAQAPSKLARLGVNVDGVQGVGLGGAHRAAGMRALAKLAAAQGVGHGAQPSANCLGPSKRLCDQGVYVGDKDWAQHGDVMVDAAPLEDSYRWNGVAPNRELSSNTIGGDWFGHIGGSAPITREEVQRAKAPVQQLAQKGMFRSYMLPLAGEPGGREEPAYEELPRCPCGGGGLCLDFLRDEVFDQGPSPCFCDCSPAFVVPVTPN